MMHPITGGENGLISLVMEFSKKGYKVSLGPILSREVEEIDGYINLD